MKLKRNGAQINVSMPAELKEGVEEVAAQMGLSMSEFAREAIQEKLRRYENKKAKK